MSCGGGAELAQRLNMSSAAIYVADGRPDASFIHCALVSVRRAAQALLKDRGN
jgi:hypothetical protein